MTSEHIIPNISEILSTFHHIIYYRYNIMIYYDIISADNTSLQMMRDVLMFDKKFSGGVVCPLESVMFTTSRQMGKRSV